MAAHETKGLTMARLARSMALAEGSAPDAEMFASTQSHWADGGLVTRSLDQQSTGEFMTYAAEDLIGAEAPTSIPAQLVALGAWALPPRTNVITGSGGPAVTWVAEGEQVAITGATFSRSPIEPHKLVSLLVATKELVRSSTIAAERAIRTVLVNASTLKINQSFLSSDAATDARPAGILSGADLVAGDTMDAAVEAAFAQFVAGGGNLARAVWILHPLTAAGLGRVRGSGDTALYPQVSAVGGTLYGLPVLVSDAMTAEALALVDPTAIAIADAGAQVDVALNALLFDGEGGSQSMWQANLAAIRLVRYLGWTTLRTDAVLLVAAS